jgi:deoxycytidine triphosphate deaminase
MFISATNILELIDCENPIISPCDRTFIEGNFYDLRLEQIFVPQDDSWSTFIGVNGRNTPSVVPLPSVDSRYLVKKLEAENDVWRLYPGFYLAQTIETITPPQWLVALLDERTTMFRGGAIVRSTKIPQGFSGKITAAIHIPDMGSVTLEKNARFLSVCFALSVTLKLDAITKEPELPLQISFDGGHAYQGIYGGDKVVPMGVERGF